MEPSDVQDASERLRQFEERLDALKRRMEHGLVERARGLRELAARIETGDEAARRILKTEAHKLRGVAGSYGHQHLTDLATEVEQRASMSPANTVVALAHKLADLAQATSERGIAKKAGPSTPPPPVQGMTTQERLVSERPRIESRVSGEPTRALRVIAMDDDPVTQRLLGLTLCEVGGFDAQIVGSAGEALELLSERCFDVIVSDAMMPDMNGREFCVEARARGIDLPIIILSAATPDELGWVQDVSGPNAWLRKPFKPTALVHDIARIVEKNRSAR